MWSVNFLVKKTPEPPLSEAGFVVWGNNDVGQLGLGDTSNRSFPTYLGSDATEWASITLSDDVGCFVRYDGSLWMTGDFNGYSPSYRRSSPVQIGSSTDWSSVIPSNYFTLGIQTDGTLWSWGWNTYGNLGHSDQVHRSEPTQIGVDTDWKLIAPKDDVALATRDDDTLWSWGHNNGGQLGLGDNIDRSSPTQVGSNTWSKISCGEYHAGGIRTNGTLWMWGTQNFGEMGDDTNYADYDTPIEVYYDSTAESDSWAEISLGTNLSAGIKSDGSLWTWGRNDYGQLGHGDLIYRSRPTQVGSDTDWKYIYSGSQSMLAIRTDNTLWMWGSNSNGALGLDQVDSSRVSSPVQIGSGITWNYASMQYWSVAAKIITVA